MARADLLRLPEGPLPPVTRALLHPHPPVCKTAAIGQSLGLTACGGVPHGGTCEPHEPLSIGLFGGCICPVPPYTRRIRAAMKGMCPFSRWEVRDGDAPKGGRPRVPSPRTLRDV